MNKVQLFLDNEEVELTSDIVFPLNKTFESLNNPTKIFVDYSKTISIPATKHNNKILGHAYRFDKVYVDSNTNNLGLYMNPMKRIPAKLMYNGELLLDGYAKYMSSEQTGSNVKYNINLYGAIGDVFQSLLDVVVSESKLSDEQKNEPNSSKYILDDLVVEHRTLNKEFVQECWHNEPDTLSDSPLAINTFGVAPAHRGLYDDFESTSGVGFETVTISDGTPKSIEDVLKAEWVYNLVAGGMDESSAQARVDAIDFKALIGDGVNEHNLRQFRSYEQKPYIYFARLLKMYQKKCKDLTGYELQLDPTWFNSNNPYWSKSCYMLDYLAGRGINEDQSTAFTGYSKGPFTAGTYNDTRITYYRTVTYKDFPYEITHTNTLKTAPFNIDIAITQKAADDDLLTPGPNGTLDSMVAMGQYAHASCEVTFTNKYGVTRKFYWWGANLYSLVEAHSPEFTEENFNKTTAYYNDVDKNKRTITGHTYLPIPSMSLTNYNTEGLTVEFKIGVSYPKSGNSAQEAPFLYRYRKNNGSNPTFKAIVIGVNDNNQTPIMPNTEIYNNWKTNTTLHLKNLYVKDEPLFNVVLQYTKMFGLLWVPDYHKKTITIMTRPTYFNNSEVIDWTKKFDGSKSTVIEPISFNTKYVNFNYDDIDAYRYSGYKTKYGLNYGAKRMKTKYEFDSKSQDLFSGVHPSSISTKSYIYLPDLIDWNTTDKITKYDNPIPFIDSEDTDQSKSANINGWYFRDSIIDLKDDSNNTMFYYVSDASLDEIAEDKFYWYSNPHALNKGLAKQVWKMPKFSPVINFNEKKYGYLFNLPNEDYTKSKELTTTGNNFIYDLFWRDYINERYDSNNKKVTAYFNLSITDYKNFTFNKFVVVNNQLFVVNKIYDYNPNNTGSTKVELVQVYDMNKYKSGHSFDSDLEEAMINL